MKINKILFLRPQNYEWSETDFYMEKALKKLGYEVIIFDDWHAAKTNGISFANKKILEQVEQHKPDMVLMMQAAHILPETLQKIKCIKVMYNPDVREHAQEYIIERAKYCDFLFQKSIGNVEEYKQLGINAFYLPEAADIEDHFPEDFEYENDVIFIGHVRKKRLDLMTHVAKYARDTGMKLKIFGNAPTAYLLNRYYADSYVFRKTHTSICNKSKISITWDWCPEVKNSWSNRIWKVMATNCLYMAKYVEGMEEYFGPNGDKIVWFETIEEAIEKINYYLSHEEERKKIVKRAQEFIKNSQTYNHRMKEMMKVCES